MWGTQVSKEYGRRQRVCCGNTPVMLWCPAETLTENGRGGVVGQEGSLEEVCVCAESYRPRSRSPGREDGEGSFQLV